MIFYLICSFKLFRGVEKGKVVFVGGEKGDGNFLGKYLHSEILGGIIFFCALPLDWPVNFADGRGR